MVYVMLAEGFEEIEALAVVDILKRANISTKTVGVTGKEVTGSHGIKVISDITDNEISLSDMQMIVLPGGMPGTVNLEKSSTIQDALDYAYSNQIWISAICAAPSILGHKNLLNQKKATCYPGFEEDLNGYIKTDDSVVVDGNIITGKGPGVAIPFALKIVEILKSKELSLSICQSMQCNG